MNSDKIILSHVSSNGNTFAVLTKERGIVEDIPDKLKKYFFKTLNVDGIITEHKLGLPRFFEPCGWEIHTCGNGLISYAFVRKYLSEYCINIDYSCNTSKAVVFIGHRRPNLITKINVPHDEYDNRFITCSVIDVGEPHVVCKDALSVNQLKYLSNHEIFKPMFGRNINATRFSVVDNNTIKTLTYESGVNALTGSCGTGSIASYICSKLESSYDNKIKISQIGGDAYIYEQYGRIFYGTCPSLIKQYDIHMSDPQYI